MEKGITVGGACLVRGKGQKFSSMSKMPLRWSSGAVEQAARCAHLEFRREDGVGMSIWKLSGRG